jgi:hypothetical protein
MEIILNIEIVHNELKLVPTKLELYSKERNCFYDVPKKISLDGGKIHNGWILHENDFFFEAERHVVWENDKGDLVNITPLVENSNRNIFFVSHNDGFIYNGQFLPNVRVNSTKNKVVDDYIYVLEKVDFLLTFSTRKSETEIEIAEPIKLVLDHLDYLGNVYYSYLKKGGNERTTCFCTSPKMYKNCHFQKIKSEIDTAIKKIKVY